MRQATGRHGLRTTETKHKQIKVNLEPSVYKTVQRIASQECRRLGQVVYVALKRYLESRNAA